MALRKPQNASAVMTPDGEVHVQSAVGDLWCEQDVSNQDLIDTEFDESSLCEECRDALIDEGYGGEEDLTS